MSTPVSVPTSNGAGGFSPGRKALAGSQLDLVTRAAHAAMVASGLQITPMKTKRIVRRFEQALRRARVTFHQFLESEANRDRVHMIDPSLSKVIAYMDRTGETAVKNVMRQRGF